MASAVRYNWEDLKKVLQKKCVFTFFEGNCTVDVSTLAPFPWSGMSILSDINRKWCIIPHLVLQCSAGLLDSCKCSEGCAAQALGSVERRGTRPGHCPAPQHASINQQTAKRGHWTQTRLLRHIFLVHYTRVRHLYHRNSCKPRKICYVYCRCCVQPNWFSIAWWSCMTFRYKETSWIGICRSIGFAFPAWRFSITNYNP